MRGVASVVLAAAVLGTAPTPSVGLEPASDAAVDALCTSWRAAGSQPTAPDADALLVPAAAQARASSSPEAQRLGALLQQVLALPAATLSPEQAEAAQALADELTAVCGLPSTRSTTPRALPPTTGTAWAYFRSSTSLTDAQTAGVLGNLIYESGLEPTRVQFGCSGTCGFGIAQWTRPGPRYSALVAFASARGLDHRSLDAQLQFVWHELVTQPSWGLAQLRACTSVSCATSEFMRRYERPASTYLTPRLSRADEAHATYAGDRDVDGVPDVLDLCPTIVGPATDAGCPVVRAIGTRADFDANGVSDVFFYGPGASGDRVRWGSTPRSFDHTTQEEAVAGAYAPLAGDFNGDGATDIIWYGPGSRPDSKWAGTTGSKDMRGGLPEAIVGDYRPFVGDFDGNGVDDVFFYGYGTLPDKVRWGLGPGSWDHVTTSEPVNGRYDPVAGDFNGDGTDDVLWYGPGSAPDSKWAGRHGERTFTKGIPETVVGTYRPVVGDFDDDAIDDVFFYGPGRDPDVVRWGTALGTFASTNTPVSVNGVYTPLAGDYDGDGADDIIWYGYGYSFDAKWSGRQNQRTFGTTHPESIVGQYRPF